MGSNRIDGCEGGYFGLWSVTVEQPAFMQPLDGARYTIPHIELGLDTPA
jgi:hypothetical protein